MSTPTDSTPTGSTPTGSTPTDARINDLKEMYEIHIKEIKEMYEDQVLELHKENADLKTKYKHTKTMCNQIFMMIKLMVQKEPDGAD